MPQILAILIGLAIVFFIGLFVAIPPPFGWVRDAGNVVLAALAGVQWTIYTNTNHPDKLAAFAAKYLPVEAVQALIQDGKDAFSQAVAKAKGVILRE